MRTIILFMGVILSYSCVNDQSDIILSMHKAYDSTMQIICDNGRGSGTYIGNDTILTAYHVVKGAKEIYIDSGSEYLEMKLIKWNEDTDLALLKTVKHRSITAEPIKIAEQAPELGDLVYAVGFHFGAPHLKLMNRGIVSQLYDDKQGNSHIFYDAPINPGVSGGCLLNDKYEIIGVNQMIFTTTGAWCGISLSCHTDTLHKFLQD